MLPNCFVTGFFAVAGYFVAAMEGIARTTTITIAAPRRTRDVEFMRSPSPIDASGVPPLVCVFPRGPHRIQARLHLGFGADVLRLIKTAISQRLGQTVHRDRLLFVVVRVLIAAAVAEVLHQTRRGVADVERDAGIVALADFADRFAVAD